MKILADGSEHNARETIAVLAEMGILLLGSGGLIRATPSISTGVRIGRFRRFGTADVVCLDRGDRGETCSG